MFDRPPLPSLLRRLTSAPWRLYRRPLTLGAAAAALSCASLASIVGADDARAVVVASRDLPAGHVVAVDDVELVDRAVGAIPDDALTISPLGRATNAAIVAGEVVVERRLGRRGASAAATLVPADHVAVAVARDLAPPGALVGDRVDLLSAGFELRARLLVSAATIVADDDRAFAVAVPAESATDVVDAVLSGSLVAALAGS